MQPLRVGVVGVGYLGRYHALIYSRMPSVRLVGVADLDAARAEAVAREAGCAPYTRAEDLLGRVDAVSIVVPTSEHLAVTRPFLSQGVHTLLEKPIAASLEEAAELVALGEAAGALLQIGHLERFNAGVMALAERIGRPRFIEAHRMGSFVERATDVDVVSDLMIHDIDIILALVDSDITGIAAVGTPVLTDHLDIANARLEFANGAVANVIASRVSDKKMRRIRVFQERCYLSLDFVAQTLDLAFPAPREQPGREGIRRERVEIDAARPLDRELESFVECVRQGARPLVDGRAGLKALDVALQVKARIQG